MRFKNQRQSSSMPTIELTPMLNVMMTTLAFFVMISMTLSSEQAVDVQLPSTDTKASEQQDIPEPLVVDLNLQQQILLGKLPVTKEQLLVQMRTYLEKNPKGSVLLKPDPELPYEQVIQLLGEMREVGGDRVSLAVAEN